MIVPDLNLLIYAHNAADHRHVAAKTWWEDCVNGDEPVGQASQRGQGETRNSFRRQANGVRAKHVTVFV